MTEGYNRQPEKVYIKHHKEIFTGVEYEKALQDLKAFTKHDVSEIKTLADLNSRLHDSETGLDIGRALEIVSVRNGEYQEGLYHYDDSQHENIYWSRYVMRKPVDTGEIFLANEINHKTILLNQTNGRNELYPNYALYVPLNSEITEEHTYQQNSSREYIEQAYVRAFEVPDGDALGYGVYDPAKEPDNAEVQRRYAQILQRGITDVLSVAEEPAKIPPELDATFPKE